MFDTDAAATRSSRMWRKLAGLYEKASYGNIEKGDIVAALRCARIADVCFWQATGEGESICMADLLAKATGETGQ